MLQVTKIIEGGIDLTSGEKIDQGIVIHNGIQEVTIPISQQSLESIVLMYAQMVEIAEQKGNGGIPLSPEDRKTVQGWVDNAPPQMRPVERAPVPPHPRPVPPAPPPEDASPPSSDIDEEDGFEPGEDYADSGTGVGSL
jgi:hypothetical protein